MPSGVHSTPTMPSFLTRVVSTVGRMGVIRAQRVPLRSGFENISDEVSLVVAWPALLASCLTVARYPQDALFSCFVCWLYTFSTSVRLLSVVCPRIGRMTETVAGDTL